jgi:hypothetical protein
MNGTSFIRAMGLYLLLASGAWFTIDEARFRAATLVVIGGVAAKTAIAWYGRER